jgi:flagellar motor protein MotB
MNEEDAIDFNFWPAFADLMLAVVLILCLVLFYVSAVLALGTVNLKQVEEKQKSMRDSIARTYGVTPVPLGERLHGISSNKTDNYDIKVQDDLNQQRITFSDKILFGQDDIILNETGKNVLRVVGENLRPQLNDIREIQIQGHADNRPTRFGLNVRLAAERSIAVFEFFRSEVRIDPAEKLMSATSFGEYKPVQRGDDDYTLNLIEDNNIDDRIRSQNRRIELVLIYNR